MCNPNKSEAAQKVDQRLQKCFSAVVSNDQINDETVGYFIDHNVLKCFLHNYRFLKTQPNFYCFHKELCHYFFSLNLMKKNALKLWALIEDLKLAENPEDSFPFCVYSVYILFPPFCFICDCYVMLVCSLKKKCLTFHWVYLANQEMVPWYHQIKMVTEFHSKRQKLLVWFSIQDFQAFWWYRFLIKMWFWYF